MPLGSLTWQERCCVTWHIENVKGTVFWDTTPCSLVCTVHRPEGNAMYAHV